MLTANVFDPLLPRRVANAYRGYKLALRLFGLPELGRTVHAWQT